MNRLFFKIFVGFWLITIIVALAMIATNRYIADFEKSPKPSAYELGQAAKGILNRTAEIARTRSAKELELWLHGLPSIHSITAYVINIEQPRRSTPVTEEITQLATRLTISQPILATKTGQAAIYGRLLVRDGQPVAKLMIAAPLPPSPIVYFFTKYIWLRLLAAIIISGIICFLMAKLITRPLVALRMATQQLADGELDARFNAYKFSNDEITELGYDFNNMAERLQQNIEEQKQLVRDISHELRSPLGRIQVALALAQRKHGEDTAELLRVEKECDRLNTLIAKLLVVPNYNQPLDDCVDLVALINDIANDDQLEAQQANQSIVVKTDLEELLITTSGSLLWHAVDNLTRNALRYTPDGTTVTILLSTDNKKGTVNIIVRDQGSGVPDDKLEKIFNSFYRVENARGHRNNGGYGLGLSIASRVVEHHSGSIIARNISGGFEIEIVLPDTLLTQPVDATG